jgi:uncharacterized protein YbjT (DUF2867 family)
MSHQYKVACVFGGTGFIGTQIVRVLAQAGYRVKVATRIIERAAPLKVTGQVGQVTPFPCCYGEDASIEEAVKGCDVVVNAIGILYQKGKNTFQRAHVDIPEKIATAAAKQGVKRLVHISALGVEEGTSKYAKSKKEGEAKVLEHFPNATILRPSVVFGPNDDFFNMFAELSRILPALPLVGGGETKFQPVYVGDVADAVMAAVTISEFGQKNPLGKLYQLGGPEILTFKEIYKRLFKHIRREKPLIPLPFWLAKIQGCAFTTTSFVVNMITGLYPKPFLTADQVETLKTDTVVAKDALTFKDLGITPHAMDAILQTYLATYRPGGRFGDKKSA